jgi:hypothetical protein
MHLYEDTAVFCRYRCPARYDCSKCKTKEKMICISILVMTFSFVKSAIKITGLQNRNISNGKYLYIRLISYSIKACWKLFLV